MKNTSAEEKPERDGAGLAVFIVFALLALGAGAFGAQYAVKTFAGGAAVSESASAESSESADESGGTAISEIQLSTETVEIQLGITDFSADLPDVINDDTEELGTCSYKFAPAESDQMTLRVNLGADEKPKVASDDYSIAEVYELEEQQGGVYTFTITGKREGSTFITFSGSDPRTMRRIYVTVKGSAPQRRSSDPDVLSFNDEKNTYSINRSGSVTISWYNGDTEVYSKEVHVEYTEPVPEDSSSK